MAIDFLAPQDLLQSTGGSQEVTADVERTNDYGPGRVDCDGSRSKKDSVDPESCFPFGQDDRRVDDRYIVSLRTPSGHRTSSGEDKFSSPSSHVKTSSACSSSSSHTKSSSRSPRSESGLDPWDRLSRAPRPSYTEAQKFFILHSRVVLDMSWPEIKDKSAEIFGQRTKGGLTSVYYRVRKAWGMQEVSKSGPDRFRSDKVTVEEKAANFSREFLANLGYFDSE